MLIPAIWTRLLGLRIEGDSAVVPFVAAVLFATEVLPVEVVLVGVFTAPVVGKDEVELFVVRRSPTDLPFHPSQLLPARFLLPPLGENMLRRI